MTGGWFIDIPTDIEDGVTISRPVGELDAFNSTQFRTAMEPVTAAPRLVIDLGGVPFVDSAGLAVLIGAARRVHEQGGKVAVACPRPALAKLLDQTGFSRTVPVTATVDEAIKALL
jgi:anti-anti-sigma factor